MGRDAERLDGSRLAEEVKQGAARGPGRVENGMAERTTGRRAIAVGASVLGCFLVGVLVGYVHEAIRTAGKTIAERPRSLRHRIECFLEKHGLIPVDPFRHVEG